MGAGELAMMNPRVRRFNSVGEMPSEAGTPDRGLKVVLFCGGQGTRLRDYSEAIPKPMVHIGDRPILWHVMKYYAHFGHKDFILCLGYKGDSIKNYFLNYDEAISNDFVLSEGGSDLHLLNSDIQDWKITFVGTGVNASIGERLKAVQKHLEGEDVFLVNYSDGLTDLHFPTYLENFLAGEKIASFLAVHSTQSFHVVSVGDDGIVDGITPMSDSNVWINGGYFIFRKEIFDYLRQGEDLVYEPYERLMASKNLFAYKYDGFWAAMDTFKDRQLLDDLSLSGQAPWEVWKPPPGESTPTLELSQ
jgi:glucose-1-phosphate cytidylyltransferase